MQEDSPSKTLSSNKLFLVLSLKKTMKMYLIWAKQWIMEMLVKKVMKKNDLYHIGFFISKKKQVMNNNYVIQMFFIFFSSFCTSFKPWT